MTWIFIKDMVSGTMQQCAWVSCAPSQSIGQVLGCALFWCWVSFCAPFTISLIEFYFIMIFIMIVVTIIGIFEAILFILNYTFRLSVTKYTVLVLQIRNSLCVSARGHSPWILDWTCFLWIPLCLHSLLGYSTGEFQALKLIVLVVFGAVD